MQTSKVFSHRDGSVMNNGSLQQTHLGCLGFFSGLEVQVERRAAQKGVGHSHIDTGAPAATFW